MGNPGCVAMTRHDAVADLIVLGVPDPEAVLAALHWEEAQDACIQAAKLWPGTSRTHFGKALDRWRKAQL